MTFREFLQLHEGKGNKRPSEQRRVLPSLSLGTKPAMPARTIPNHEPVRFMPKPQRVGDELSLVPKPHNIVPGVIRRPSDNR